MLNRLVMQYQISRYFVNNPDIMTSMVEHGDHEKCWLCKLQANPVIVLYDEVVYKAHPHGKFSGRFNLMLEIDADNWYIGWPWADVRSTKDNGTVFHHITHKRREKLANG